MAWWAEAVRAQTARWGADPDIEPRDAIELGTRLMGMLRWSQDHVGTAWPAGLATTLREAALTGVERRFGADLRATVPATFDDDQWSAYRAAFAAWATDRLEGRLDEFDEDEVHEIHRAARALGVALPGSLYERAIDEARTWREKVRSAHLQLTDDLDQRDGEDHEKHADVLLAMFAGLLDRDE